MASVTALPTADHAPPPPALLLEVVLPDPGLAGFAGHALAPLTDAEAVVDGTVLRLPVRGRDGTVMEAALLLRKAGVRALDLGLRAQAPGDQGDGAAPWGKRAGGGMAA